MPSVDRVRASYHRQIELLDGIRKELDEALKDFEQGHDAGLAALRSSTGKLGSRGSGGADTTSQASYEFKRLQGASSFAAGLILGAEKDLRSAERRLERAGSVILNAWLDTDPDIGPGRREARLAMAEAAAAVNAERTLTPNDTPGIIRAVATEDGAG